MDFDFFELFEDPIETDYSTDSSLEAEADIFYFADEDAFSEELELLADVDEEQDFSSVYSELDSDSTVFATDMDGEQELSSDYSDLDIDSTVLATDEQALTQSSLESEMVRGDSIFDPIFRLFDDIYYFFTGGCDDIVTQNHFSDDGTMDLKNNVIVEGNVHNDIQFTDQQTHGSCSLMAQEQFVHRYTGQSVPEEYLEWQAEKWGVYDPDLGTDWNGQSMVLDHFNIPHGPHQFDCEIEDLNEAISSNEDIIIGVDAREFYDDPSIPPGSGHAVAIVGRGFDPQTGDVAGFYVTDSNFPQSAHFITIDKMQSSWQGDMITVPEKVVA